MQEYEERKVDAVTFLQEFGMALSGFRALGCALGIQSPV